MPIINPGQGGGGGSPGGSDTQIQFNDTGSFGGSADLIWTTDGLTDLRHASFGSTATSVPFAIVKVADNLTVGDGEVMLGISVIPNFIPDADELFLFSLQFGGSIDATNTHPIGGITGVQGFSFNYSDQDVGEMSGAILYTGFNYGMGTVSVMNGLHVIDVVGSVGVITSDYGVLIDDIVQGVSNWAIKTGLGKVDFGDHVGINGPSTTTSPLNISSLPISSAGLAAGDVWCDTTGGFNILKIV